MVEVFKTNVTQKKAADRILTLLHKEFKHCKANFDLEDVDRILRIACQDAILDVPGVIRVVRKAGFMAEVLPDTPAPKATGQGWRVSKNMLHTAFN